MITGGQRGLQGHLSYIRHWAKAGRSRKKNPQIVKSVLGPGVSEMNNMLML